jgi:hypothetical protein
MTDKDVERVAAAIREALGLTGQQITDLRLDDRIVKAARAAIAAYEAAVGERVGELEAEVGRLTDALKEIDGLQGEINPSNYDHDDACELNAQFCYAQTIARAALTSTDVVTDAAKLGTVSLTSFDGHCVRIDFPNREDAERMYAALTGAPGNG